MISRQIRKIVEAALSEDIGTGDAASSLVQIERKNRQQNKIILLN